MQPPGSTDAPGQRDVVAADRDLKLVCEQVGHAPAARSEPGKLGRKVRADVRVDEALQPLVAAGQTETRVNDNTCQTEAGSVADAPPSSRDRACRESCAGLAPEEDPKIRRRFEGDSISDSKATGRFTSCAMDSEQKSTAQNSEKSWTDKNTRTDKNRTDRQEQNRTDKNTWTGRFRPTMSMILEYFAPNPPLKAPHDLKEAAVCRSNSAALVAFLALVSSASVEWSPDSMACSLPPWRAAATDRKDRSFCGLSRGEEVEHAQGKGKGRERQRQSLSV